MIKTIFPSNKILKKHIECFYLYEGVQDSSFSYLAFPHFNSGLSFFKGASIQRKNYCVEISEDINAGNHIEVLGKYLTPVYIKYAGVIREISIVFKPLGINRFFSENYYSLAPDFSQKLINKQWNNFAADLFLGNDDINKLEFFLLDQLVANNELEQIEPSLNILQNNIEDLPITIIANQLGYNLKTFQRHFKKYVGCSPIEYRRICRFRNSVLNKLNNNELKNLTDVTYESGYFDQSYFIKEFRKLTNHSPKDFFKRTSKVDGDNIIWEIK